MSQPLQNPRQQLTQFEVLPLERSVELVEQLPRPERLTVTCSPRHGPDESVAIARRLRALGHDVTVHVAARMVRGRAHLNELLDGMAQAEADLFLIGGDATPPQGPWSSAVDLLPLVAEHPQRPSEIGIAGYPEGHPLIDAGTLADVLEQKSALAAYITTQLCFDPEALLAWLRDTRERGVTLPVLVGLPGVVSRRRLLEMSVRIGVGPSLSFLRKQRGLRKLLGPSTVTPDRVYDGLAPYLEDRELNIMGFHYYTFNQVVNTWKWEREKREERDRSVPYEEAVTR
ncbi:MAG TPA: methylenetetrahydrofolate reductase [Actinomycetota bacterium]|nr:methylenetetrahydrofolate reductase [Actinomycetota bacterium]